MSGPKHSCGIVGISSDSEAADSLYTALMIIQHRGQESAGISVFDGTAIKTAKGDGLVDAAITKEKLAGLHGKTGIGHVRYATTGSKDYVNAQPLAVKTSFGMLAVAHNGDVTNFTELRNSYMKEGRTFLTDSDSELILKLITKHMTATGDPVKSIRSSMEELDGAYSLVILVNGDLYAVRDPYAFRPLCLGKTADGYIAVSESTAIDALRGEFIRDVKPGEICRITKDGIESFPYSGKHPCAMCMFEWVYFARPDSVIDGKEVYSVRRNIGRILARECPADVDLVMPIPDSGRAHAIGYAIEAGIPYEEGFMKNRFAGRTFILPEQKLREKAVSSKMIPIKSTVAGKRIMIIDDSIVRGTTLKILVSMLKNAGAKEVHVRVGSPPIIAPCYYGVDMKTRDQFIANRFSVEGIRKELGADSLGYISLKGLVEAIGIDENDLCLACTNGKYPTHIENEEYRFRSVIPHLRFHKFPEKARGVIALGKGKFQTVSSSGHFRSEIPERTQYFSPVALGAASAQFGYVEIFGPEPVLLDHFPLDLPHLSFSESTVGAEKLQRDERPPGADLPRDEVQISGCGGYRILVLGDSRRIRRDHRISLDRSVQRDSGVHPPAESLVEQIRLVGVDEHHLKIVRKNLYGARPVSGIRREDAGHHLLVSHILRDQRKNILPPGAPRKLLSHIPELLVLLRDRVGEVCSHGAFEIASDDPLPDEVGDRPHGAESLDPEIIRESARFPDNGSVFRYDPRCLFIRDGIIPHGDFEAVSDKIPDLYLSGSAVRSGNGNVFEIYFSQIRISLERHELGGDRSLVLRPGEAYALFGDPEGAGHNPHQTVGLPVAAGDLRYSEIAVLLGSRGIRYLFNDEILRQSLEMPSRAIGIAEIIAHADLRFGGEAFSVTHLRFRNNPRRPWKLSLWRPARFPSLRLRKGSCR
ncbi:MAG: amidophosphoribosyltransferase [Candidatus Methanomethylophilaceae archaeon]|nr:amidophosphoribosyltransferase [Candidatus Methanomethylophilaceae archaeon]